MIAQAAATTPREVEPARSPDSAPAVRTPEKRETEDPAVVIAITGLSNPFESYRGNSGSFAVGRATEEAAQELSPASAVARLAQEPHVPVAPAAPPFAASSVEPGSGVRAAIGGAPDPSGPSPADLANLPARAGQRTASMNPDSAQFTQPARASAPPPAPPARPSPIAIDTATAPSAATEVVKAATAKPPDAEGPPNKQVSTVQVEFAGAAAQSAQPTSPQLEPRKKSTEPELAVARGEKVKAVETFQANALHVGAIKDLMEYTRNDEQDRRQGLTGRVSGPPAEEEVSK